MQKVNFAYVLRYIYLYQTLFYQIPPDILTHLLVFGSPKGSPNISNIRQNIRRYLAEKCLIIYKSSVKH